MEVGNDPAGCRLNKGTHQTWTDRRKGGQYRQALKQLDEARGHA